MLVLPQPLLQRRRRQRVTVVQGRQQLTSVGVQALRQVLRQRQRRRLCGPPKRWRRGEAKMAE
jgi:hypothetical protein